VDFLDGYRSTPELSFAVRHNRCDCGIMVTASHNPPSDNAVKVYWSTGGQLLPPHDRGVIDCVAAVTNIARVPFGQGIADGTIICCQQPIDRAYQAAVLEQSLPGPRDLKLVYSPMHGVGAASIVPVLHAAGFDDVTVFAPHATPDGDFPNVPGHVANPENTATFAAIIEHARAVGADLVLSTDPDADRLGCAAPVARGGEWRTLSGNQIGALLAEFVLDGRRRAGRLGREHYVLKTLVTTEMIRRIADSYGIATHGKLHVGFKHIGAAIDEYGPERFVIAAEESHGYLAGSYARDKDATVAALLMAELAASVKAAGLTLHEKLDALYWQHGCHSEVQISRTLPGSEGMQRMAHLMLNLRRDPPATLGGLKVIGVHDYLLETPSADMVVLDLEGADNRVAIRPSGTEPKIKFYLFAFEPPELIGDLAATKAELRARLARVSDDLARLE
ncbi:MAG TPA: phospho-sugar mutase, partial [Pirellulales bacterium]|nr:phospho-sugar mutase [Pirellulales bacterium]